MELREVTPLTPEEEQRFQQWVALAGIPDVDHPDSFYDYRGYWKEFGGAPIRFGVDHFPDTYKQHGHPTFSVESKYSRGVQDGGQWLDDTTLIPPMVPSHVVVPSLSIREHTKKYLPKKGQK